MSTEDPAYRPGEAYPVTGPCSMASPCPGPDAPRDQHGAGCPLSATATSMQHKAAPDILTPEVLAELRRLLDECQLGNVVVNDLRPTHNAIWLDSRYRDETWEVRRMPKWLWAVAVIGVPGFGPLAWLFFGRPVGPRRGVGGGGGNRPLPRPPDDNPDFLRGL